MDVTTMTDDELIDEVEAIKGDGFDGDGFPEPVPTDLDPAVKARLDDLLDELNDRVLAERRALGWS